MVLTHVLLCNEAWSINQFLRKFPWYHFLWFISWDHLHHDLGLGWCLSHKGSCQTIAYLHACCTPMYDAAGKTSKASARRCNILTDMCTRVCERASIAWFAKKNRLQIGKAWALWVLFMGVVVRGETELVWFVRYEWMYSSSHATDARGHSKRKNQNFNKVQKRQWDGCIGNDQRGFL